MKRRNKLVTTIHSQMRLPILIIFFLTGCAGPRVASDLLVKTESLNAPLVESGYIINTGINPKINNYERIDNSVKESLTIALKKANIFNDTSNQFYTIKANIEIASQAAVSFGMFNGKLQINYTVFNEKNNKIIDKTIYTVAGSDEWFFIGAKRHSRARAVNIAKNVLEFTDYLKANL